MTTTNPGSTTPTPDWAYPLQPDQFQRFLTLVAAGLDRLDVAGDRAPDPAGWLRLAPPGFGRDAECRLNLGNLAQSVAGSAPDEWPQLIDGFLSRSFGGSLAAMIEQHRGEGSVDPRADLRVCVRSRSWVEAAASVPNAVLRRPLARDLVSVLVLDYPENIVSVSPVHLTRWQLSADQAWDLATANTKREPMSVTPIPTDGEQLLVLEGNDYVASHALWLEAALDKPLPLGALVSIPTRRVVVAYPIEDGGWRRALPRMVLESAESHREGPYSISPAVYWWHRGTFTVIPVVWDNRRKRPVIVRPAALDAVTGLLDRKRRGYAA